MLRKKTLVRDFTQGGITKQLLVFAYPLMLSNLLQVAYNLVDMMVIGQFVGSAGLAAVSSGGDIMNIGTIFCIGFSSAGQIMISQHIGKGSREGVRKTIGTMFSFLMFFSVFITLVGILCIELLLDAINVPIEAYPGALSYCRVCFYGMFFIYGYNIISAILRGMGDSKHPFMFIATAAIINFILDLVFIAVLGLGSWGAALATVAAQGISFLASLVFLYHKRDAFEFEFKKRNFIIDIVTLKDLIKLGLPMALQHSAIVFSKLFVNSYINAYGLIMAAVNAIGNKIGTSANIVTQALGTASMSMIGQNFGANKQERIRKIIYVSMGCGLIFTMILSFFMILFPEGVFGLFDRNPDVLRSSHIYVIIAVIHFNGFALRHPMMALINGVGNTLLSFVIGIIDGIIGRICLAILLGVTFDMGIRGFWFGDVFASYIPFVIGGLYFWMGLWKRRKLAVHA
jgi:putative MATE family efflux protein